MFGIGYQEMFVILVAALVIFGPGKLPEVAGQVGRWVRDFRRMTADLTGEFEKTVGDVEDIKRTLRGEVDSITAEVDSVSKSVKKDLAKAAGAPDGKAKAKPATGTGVKPRPTKVGTKPAGGTKSAAASMIPGKARSSSGEKRERTWTVAAPGPRPMPMRILGTAREPSCSTTEASPL